MALKFIQYPVSSNKTQTLPDNTPTQTLPSPPTAIPLPWAPTPFIDRISLVLDVPAHDAHDIYSGLMTMQGDLLKKGGNPSDHFFIDAGSKAKWGNFKWAKRITIPSLVDHKKYPLLQAAISGKQVTALRIDFVPVDLGEKGLSELSSVLGALMPDGWGYFVKHGRLTRIDVAVDFPKVLIDDFHFLPLQAATTKQWRVNGKLETYTHGKPAGNHTAIYDRKTKRIAQGKSWIGKEGMRIERRMKPPSIAKLTDLVKLPNPFKSMRLVSMPTAPPAEQTKMLYVWDLFRRAADAEGLVGALALLPEEKRTLYRKHLDANTQPWWNPDAIWKNWPKMLDELKIGTKSAWQ